MFKNMWWMMAFLMTISVVIQACDDAGNNGNSQKEEMNLTEANQQRLLKAVPPPALNDSLERRNLVKRLNRFNDANKVSYIYLVDYGKVMAFYTIKGKVSSVNSLLTTPDQVVYGVHGNVVIQSPDLDGSYGSNGNAIFFFTTEDVYVEWAGRYMLVDQPLQLTTPPELIRVVDDDHHKKSLPAESDNNNE